MQAIIRTATDQQKLAVDRNTKYYSGLTQQFLPGDLVFAFTERKGDPPPTASSGSSGLAHSFL